MSRRAGARALDFSLGAALFVVVRAWVSAAAGPSPDGTGVRIIAVVATFLAYLVYEVLVVAL